MHARTKLLREIFLSLAMSTSTKPANDGLYCFSSNGFRVENFASEHRRTLSFWSWDLKILKKTGVNSSRFCEANVKSPNGPTPPGTFERFAAHAVCASFQLGSYISALSMFATEKVTSTSACTCDIPIEMHKCQQ